MFENSLSYMLVNKSKGAGMESDFDEDSESSNTENSSDSSSSSDSEEVSLLNTRNGGVTCDRCGRGPFRAINRHLVYCTGVWSNQHQCVLCKKLFPTEKALKEHHLPLNSCDMCYQVFTNENSFYSHRCPKGFKLPLVLFCSESMPKPCSVCKLFFTCEKTLSFHVTKVHSSVVKKVCVIRDPSMLADKKVAQLPHTTKVKSIAASPGVLNQTINGNISVIQNNVISPSTAALHVDQSHSHHSTPLSASPATTDPTPDSTVSDNVSSPVPTILALFENKSHEMALKKRMNTGWRSKTPYRCRHCGAIFRQPSRIISHRYLHRGRRMHQCHCGRAFKHRLHLLRHCVQHAEAISYICVSCGDTFRGAKLLAEHLKGKAQKNSAVGCMRKVKKKCKMPFICDCGELFFRPSAYIWHQLKNRTKINICRFT